MKRILGRIHLYWNVCRNLFFLRGCLANGFYQISRSGKEYQLRKRHGLTSFLVFSWQKSGPVTDRCSFLITPYEKKYVFFVSGIVAEFYPPGAIYRKWLENMLLLGGLLPYPLCKKTAINIRHRYTVEPRIRENRRANDDEIVLRILEGGVQAHKTLRPEVPGQSAVYYVQHGDLRDANILAEGENIFFIDYDEIGYYPAFFDFFRFVFVQKKALIWKKFLQGEYNDLLASTLSQPAAEFRFNPLMDYYLSLFIKHSTLRLDSSYSDLVPEPWQLTLNSLR